MASGKIHTAATVSIATPIAGVTGLAAGLLVGDPIGVGAAAAVGALSGILLTPDLDQSIIDRTEYRLLKWTFGMAALWIGLWFPYAVWLPHRSPVTHWPILSTSIRILWLKFHPFTIIALGLWTEFDWTYILTWPINLVGIGLFIAWFYGLTLADFGHWALDGFPMKRGDKGIFNKHPLLKEGFNYATKKIT